MSMSVDKSGPASVEVGETNIPFTLTATVSGFSENPSFNPGPVAITDAIPTNYTVADAAGGTVFGNQITWIHTFSQANPTFSRTVLINATTDPCDAGKIVSNTLTVSDIPVTDCRGCDYTIGGASIATHYINQDTPDMGLSPLDGTSKNVVYLSTQSGGQGEACRDIRYAVTYDLSTSGPNNWTGFSFKENLTLSQSLVSIDSVTYNGVDYTAHISTTDNSPVDFIVDLGGLEGRAPAPSTGHALVITFTTGTVNASLGSSIQFSQLTVPSGPSGCADEKSFQEGAGVSIGDQSMGIAVSGPPLIEHCSIHSHTLSVSKADNFFAYDPKIILNMDPDNDGKPNFGYIAGTTAFSGNFVDTADTSFGAFEPAISGNQLIWDFSAKGSGDFKTVSNITVQLRFTCDEQDANTDDDAFSAEIHHNTFCADNNATQTENASAQYNPDSRFILRPALFAFQSPDPLYVTKEPEPWTLNITNGGDGVAYNVALVTTVGADVVFDSADIPWTDKTGQVYTWRFQFTVDPDGPGGLADLDNDGFYDDLAPAGTVSVNVNTSFIACNQLGVKIVGYSSCDVSGPNPLTDQWNQTAYCEASTPFNVAAVMASPHVSASNAFGGNLELCAEQEVLFTVKNTGLSYVYNVKAMQSLPDTGVTYVNGSSVYDLDADADGAFESTDNTLGDPVAGDGTSGNPYVWNEGQIALFNDMPPEAMVRIKYRVNANCDAVNSNMLFGAQAEWQTACDLGESTSIIAAPITLSEMNVDVVKEARNINTGGALTTQSVYGANGDVIEYRTTLNSNGQIAAQNIRLTDILPDNVLDLSTLTFIQNPADSGTGSVADPLVWNSSNIGKADGVDDGKLNPNSAFTTIFRVTLDQCAAGTGTGTVSYGCNAPGTCAAGDPKEASHHLVVTPDLDTPALSVTGSAGAGALTTLGRMEIRIKNSGGAARNLSITDTLPTGFVIDPSIPATVTNTDAGSGSIDTVTVGGAPAVPVFTLTSATGSGSQTHLLRHDQTATVAFHVVQGAHFDTMENPDDIEETVADGLDPVVPANGANAVSVAFEDTCGGAQTPETQSIPAQPQTPDLDIVILDPQARIVDVGGNESFLVKVENRGESTAKNGLLTVTIGNGWSGTLPGGCAGSIPGTVACALPDINPGANHMTTFNLTVDNDQNSLTFHAQVDGNIVNGIDADTGDNYSLDTQRARVIGYSLTKNLQSCSEADSPNPTVWVGEDCIFRVDAKWFGGGGDAISNAVVTDVLPPGQGYVSHTLATGDGFIAGALDGASPAPVASGVLTWEIPDFNTIAGHQTFRADVVVRTLNEPVNSDAAPVDHGTILTNSVDGSFSFQGVSFNSGINGFPAPAGREQTITVSTPVISIDKQVRNVTQAGSFADTAQGDAGDIFEYRLVVSNGAGRAAAYNLVVTETLPAKMNLQTFAADGIDNDQDGAIDEGGSGEGNDNGGGSGQSLRFDDSHNSALAKLDPGASATLLYRATADDTVLHQEVIVNTAQVTVDTLLGISGGQNAPQGARGAVSGARVYTAADGATVNIDPIVLITSKSITATSHTPLGGAAPYTGVQKVVIGEEIHYRLQFVVSPSTMNNWTITDTLPAGIMVIEADPIILAAGFSPGGTVTPTISGDNQTVTWDLGNQALLGTSTDQTITAEFTARIENLAANQAGALLTNTDAKTRHDDVDTLFDDITVSVQESVVTATKNIVTPVSADAGDAIAVQVVLQNTGTAPAHNVRIQDNLVTPERHMAYIVGSQSGANPPDAIDTTTLDAPIFIFNAIPAAESRTFTFNVQAEADVEPHEVLDNTVRVVWQSLPGQNSALNATGLIGADGAADGMRNGDFSGDGGLNDYETGDSADISVPAISFAKTDINPGVAPAVGTRKSYRVTIDLPEGKTDNLKVIDDLASGDESFHLENNAAVDVSYTLTGIAGINGNTSLTTTSEIEGAMNAFPADGSVGVVTWDFGAVATQFEDDSAGGALNPSIVIDYHVRIDNSSPFQAGVNLENTAHATYRQGETLAETATPDSTPGPVTTLEPQMTLAKAGRNITRNDPDFSGFSRPDAGDILEYRITIENGLTNAATAHDVQIGDTLPAHLTYLSTTSAKLNGSDIPGFNPVPAGAPNGPLLWGRGNGDETIDIPPGEAFVLIYRALVQDNVTPALSIDNRVDVDWTSLDGTDARERNGAGGVNDYAADASAPIVVLNSHTMEKVKTFDGFDTHDSWVRVGDKITYEIRVTLRETVTENVVVTDILPSDLTFLGTVSIAGDTTAPYAPASPISYTPLTDSDTPAPGSTGNLIWDFGRIENPGNNAGTDIIVIVYEAQITNVTAVSHEPLQRDLINTARVDYKLWDGSDASALTDTGQVTLAQPLLSVSKTLQTGQSDVVDGGDAVNFRIVATNTGHGPAYNIHIRDVLPPEMRDTAPTTQSVLLNGASATLAAPLYDADSGTLIWILTDAQSLLPGQDLVIHFQAFVNTGAADGLALENQALADAYFSKPSSDTDHRRQYGATPVARQDLYTLGVVLTPNHKKTVQAGASLVYTHEIDLKLGGLTGALDINTPSAQGMVWAIYQDSNDNGELDSNDAPWVNGSSVNTGRLRFFLKGVVPANAFDGWLDTTHVEASVTAGGATQTDTVFDITRVVASDTGSVSAYKEAAIDRDCDQSLADESIDDRAFSTFKELDAGHCAVYRIRFVNVGPGTVTNITVHDETPAFTVYVGGSAVYETTPPGLTPAAITEQPANGGAGKIVWTYSGGLSAEEEGSVTYEVRSAP